MKSSKLPYFFLGLSAVLVLAALIALVVRSRQAPKASGEGTTPVASPRALAESPESPGSEPPRSSPKSPEPPLSSKVAATPAALVAELVNALEAADFDGLGRLLTREALEAGTLARLKALVESTPLRLRRPGGIREVGALEINSHSRWELEFDNPQQGPIRLTLDLRLTDGSWKVEKITLPPALDAKIPKEIVADSLEVADHFLQAVMAQNFELARKFVDPEMISDAKIAGLCILFEEGNYQLRKTKPLRALFQRADTVGYLAAVETTDGKQSAEFGMTLRQRPGLSSWVVSEINLDQLLVDYTRRIAGGDPYYTPLVKNPSGGETLAIYFNFDEDEMNPRTRRQLDIVIRILRADPEKKINLSGHTDALGTAEYNDKLSSRRAKVVGEFLIKSGVHQSQLITVAKGANQPRRPNVTEDGKDNPDGRRANRRTEIYLDF
jgi:OOP family OmpA-OmpF porin